MASHALLPRLSSRLPSRSIRQTLRSPARRNASSTSSTTSQIPPPPPVEAAVVDGGSRFKTILYTTLAATAGCGAYLYSTDTRASLLHRHLVPPLLRTFVPDAEDAHHLGTAALETLYKFGCHPRDRTNDTGLGVSVFGRELQNPVGISAGLDKDARIPDQLFALGAAVVEVGGVTPGKQEGNPKPRVFRIPGVQGMVNRYGLNSEGADAVGRRLRMRLLSYARSLGLGEEDILGGSAGVPVGSLVPGKLLCVQVAKAKGTDETDVGAVIADIQKCVAAVGPYADVVVLNVSSPNTPGLRDLQAAGPLAQLLAALAESAQKVAKEYGRKEAPRVMVKVSPDEDADNQVEGVVAAVWASGADGVIVGNTTKRRDGSAAPKGIPLSPTEVKALHETGGFSGPAMFTRTRDLVGRYRRALDERGYELSVAGKKEDREREELPVTTSPDGDASVSREERRAITVPRKMNAEPKVIFATGGITTGDQALQVLRAGASVAMVYTGMVYGGAGTVTRIKGEMKKELGGV